VDITSSRKRSSASSTKNAEGKTQARTESKTGPKTDPKAERPSFAASHPEEFAGSYETSPDLIERVRQARTAAERRMREFSGNWNDYTLVATVIGQKSARAQEQKSAAVAKDKRQMPFAFEASEHKP
jgi:hypothetical protein